MRGLNRELPLQHLHRLRAPRHSTNGATVDAPAAHECVGDQAQWRDVDIAAAFAHQRLRSAHTDSDTRDPAPGRRASPSMLHDRAAFRQQQPAVIGFDVDVPASAGRSAGSRAPRARDCTRRASHQLQLRGDRCFAVRWEGQLGIPQHQTSGQDARDDGQRIDARIEHAEAAGLPDPGLARMPDAHIFLPRRRDAANRARFASQRARRLDAGGLARMPGREQRDACCFGEVDQRVDFVQRRARRFFEHHVAAVFERIPRDVVTNLRRRADRDRVDCRACARAASRRREIRARRRACDAGSRRRPARTLGLAAIAGSAGRVRSCPCRQWQCLIVFIAIYSGCTPMLRRLACAPSGLRSGRRNGGASISNTSPCWS